MRVNKMPNTKYRTYHQTRSRSTKETKAHIRIHILAGIVDKSDKPKQYKGNAELKPVDCFFSILF